MKLLLSILISCVVGVSAFSQNASNDKLFKEAYIKRVMKKSASWQVKNPKHNLYGWTNGAFYAGMCAAYEATGSKKIFNDIYKMGESNNWEAGPNLMDADDHVICQSYIDMFRWTGEDKMIQPFIETMDRFIATPFATKGIRKITWWWCDALFMAPPALVKLGITLKDSMYLKLNDKLFYESYELLYDKKEHLYARDMRFKWDEAEIDVVKENNGEKIFWSRGNGWVMGGLARILQELPDDYPTRDFYIQNFKEMAERIISLQQNDGLWRASLLDPDSYPGGEASGSGFYCYALAWGINNGIIDGNKYLEPVKKAWIGLNSLLQKNGMVGWVQPIGADPRKNFNVNSWEVYGTGAFLLAGSEVIKLSKK
jgi:rhamnogalacturonyl hydrolase YesR